jgi:hypothetical protein
LNTHFSRLIPFLATVSALVVVSVGWSGLQGQEAFPPDGNDAGASESSADAAQLYADLESEANLYWQRPLGDRFSKMKEDFESGKLALDRSSELAYLTSLLEALEISPNSQMLVFSTTSLQLRLISPRNPRAVYFNENIHLGFIPGGRIEVMSMDPQLGGIFYIFDIPRGNDLPRLERADRCMNCHAKKQNGYVPTPVIKSVLPGPTGGSLDSFRRESSGHAVPLTERFGGWHVTGAEGVKHWGNLIGRQQAGEIEMIDNPLGERCDVARYPVATSDLLAHLLHEHQNGFAHRVVEAGYRARSYFHQAEASAVAGGGRLSAPHLLELQRQAKRLVRYLLFADEVALPKGGVEGVAQYKEYFLRNRRPAGNGQALKDFDLKTRLFKVRCSYMIYSDAFAGLHPEFKKIVYRTLAEAISTTRPNPDYGYLSRVEKDAIRVILRDTLDDLPDYWH